ncbi:MAG: hypothetical protein RH945_02230 [Hyphomonas sp.]
MNKISVMKRREKSHSIQTVDESVEGQEQTPVNVVTAIAGHHK